MGGRSITRCYKSKWVMSRPCRSRFSMRPPVRFGRPSVDVSVTHADGPRGECMRRGRHPSGTDQMPSDIHHAGDPQDRARPHAPVTRVRGRRTTVRMVLAIAAFSLPRLGWLRSRELRPCDRYCPSILSKLRRFPNATSHHIWLEPEGTLLVCACVCVVVRCFCGVLPTSHASLGADLWRWSCVLVRV